MYNLVFIIWLIILKKQRMPYGHKRSNCVPEATIPWSFPFTIELWFLVVRKEDSLHLPPCVLSWAWTCTGPARRLWKSCREVSVRASWGCLAVLQTQQGTGLVHRAQGQFADIDRSPRTQSSSLSVLPPVKHPKNFHPQVAQLVLHPWIGKCFASIP